MLCQIFNGGTEQLTGTRWLSRWDKEIELAVKLVYWGLTIGRGELSHFYASC